MRKQILCILTALCLCLLCPAFAESADGSAPFSFRGMSWDMCPDEVTANESIDLTMMDLEDSGLYCITGSGASLYEYDASIYYLFYNRSLYAAIYDIPDEDAFENLGPVFESVYGAPRLLESGTIGSWIESVVGYCPPVKGDERLWYAADGTAMFLAQYDGGTTFILQAPEDTHAIRQAAISEKPAWTILLYLCGTDLETDDGSASYNLDAILSAWDSSDIRIVVQTGGTKEWQKGISSDELNRYVREGDSLHWVESVQSANMGSVTTLNDFISWGVRNYPAEHVGLILWDHGSSSVNGVCFDELYDRSSLSLPDIAIALRNNMKFLPEGFEFIGFDACLMASLECAAQMAPYARYMYASEEVEPGSGWDYETVLNWLVENPQADGWDLGRVQVQSYYDFHSDRASRTFSVIDLSKISGVVEAFDAAAKEMDSLGDDGEIVRGILRSDAFGSNNTTAGFTNMIDIQSMMENLSTYVPSASAVIDAIESAVVHRCNGAQHAGAGGLSIYYPIRMRGTMEISSFRDICPSEYYMTFVSRVSGNAEDTMHVLGKWYSVPDSTAFHLLSAGILPENGLYIATLESMDELAMASCVLYKIGEDGTLYFLGEDDNTRTDWENHTVSDTFNGTWVRLNNCVLPIELVSRSADISVYTAPILLNGKQMNLRVIYDWETRQYTLDGVCASVEVETGMVNRLFNLNEGDTFQICYYYWDVDEYKMITSDEIIVDGSLSIEYKPLPEGAYAYRIILYDLAGNNLLLDKVIYHIDDEGEATIFYAENQHLFFSEP